MRWDAQRRLAVILGLATFLGLGPCAALAAGSTDLDRQLLEAVDGLRSGALAPDDATELCANDLAASDDGADFREVMTTFLDVPSADAIPALCRAVVHGVVAGTITDDNLRPVLGTTNKNTEAFEAGRLLRAVYFAHHLKGSSEDVSGAAQ